MVFKAGRQLIYRKLETAVVTLLLLIGVAMPAASNGGPLAAVTRVSATRHHGHVLLAVYDDVTHEISTRARDVSTKGSTDLVRNGHARILKKVRTQLTIARKHFRGEREFIAHLYRNATTTLQTEGSKNRYHYEWLPSQSLVWYKEHVVKLDQDKRVFVLLPALWHSLHNFSVTLAQMLQFNRTQHSKFYALRNVLLTDLSKHLIAVLQEVEMSPLSQLDRQSTTNNETSPIVVGGDGWNPNPDHTTMLIQDWGVLTIYYRFLKDWQYISYEMVRDQRKSRGEPTVSGNTTVGNTTETPTASDTTTTEVTSGTAASFQRRPSAPLLPCVRHMSGGKLRKSPDRAVKPSS